MTLIAQRALRLGGGWLVRPSRRKPTPHAGQGIICRAKPFGNRLTYLLRRYTGSFPVVFGLNRVFHFYGVEFLGFFHVSTTSRGDRISMFL